MWNNLGLTLGGAFVWVSQTDDVSKIKKDDRFLLNINANAGLAYQLSKTNTVLTANYKFVGQVANVDGYYWWAALGTLSPYGWVDASVQQSFLAEAHRLCLGCRNVLNVINTTLTQTSLLGITTERNYPIANGRMFYLKLSYNLNIKYLKILLSIWKNNSITQYRSLYVRGLPKRIRTWKETARGRRHSN